MRARSEWAGGVSKPLPAAHLTTSEVEDGKEIRGVFQPSVPARNSAEDGETSLALFDGMPFWLSFSAASRQ